jgi:hypothetical protein
LRLVGKDLAAARVDHDLYPLHVVIAVRGVVAERFDTGEVRKAIAGALADARRPPAETAFPSCRYRQSSWPP